MHRHARHAGLGADRGALLELTAGAVASPASWPPQLINVRIGGVTQNDGEKRTVSRVVMHPDYLLTNGYDISLLQLSQSSTMAPTQVAGAGEREHLDARARSRRSSAGA